MVKGLRLLNQRRCGMDVPDSSDSLQGGATDTATSVRAVIFDAYST